MRSRLLGLALAGLLGACAPGRQVLVETASEESASEVLVHLGEFGIPARKRKGEGRTPTWTVTVPEDELHEAHRILLTLGLPRPEHAGFEAMLEDTGVIPSRSSEHARLVHATSEELAATLEEHEQVVSARVHIVQPEASVGDRLAGEAPSRPTASVLVRYVPGDGLVLDGERPAAGVAPDATLQDAYRETLDRVFEDVRRNTEGLLDARLAGLVRTELDAVGRRVVDRSDRIVEAQLARLRAAVEERLEARGEAADGVFRSEVREALTQVDEAFARHTEGLEAELADALGGLFRDQAVELGEGFARRARAAMDELVRERARSDRLEATLGLDGDDPVEVRFFKLMLQDFYTLPSTLRRIAEQRTGEDPPGLPFASDEVRMLVAHAVEGMWPWDVNVVFSPIERPRVRAAGAVEGTAGEALEGAGARNGLEARNARLVQLAAALGAASLLLVVLLTRERARNAALRRQLGSGAP